MKSFPAPFILVNAKFIGAKNMLISRKEKKLNDVPALARLTPKHSSGLGISDDLFFGAVPANFLSRAIRNVPEMRDDGRLMTNSHVGDGRFSRAHAFDKILHVQIGSIGARHHFPLYFVTRRRAGNSRSHRS